MARFVYCAAFYLTAWPVQLELAAVAVTFSIVQTDLVLSALACAYAGIDYAVSAAYILCISPRALLFEGLLRFEV